HRGGTRFDQMALGTIITYILANLVKRQPANQYGAENETEHHGRQHAQDGPEGQKMENTQRRKTGLEPVREIHQHDAPSRQPRSSRKTSATRSICILRDPLTSIVTSFAPSPFSRSASADSNAAPSRS